MNKIKKLSIACLFASASLFASDLETIAKKEGVLSEELLSHFKELFILDSFIETGTYAGDTTYEASKVFSEVHSIEIWEPLYKAAQKRFASTSNITLYLGDTTKELSQMMKNSSGKRLYWLDAHSSGEGTGGIVGFSPIIDELDQILLEEGDVDSIILIDDLRGMCHIDPRTNLPLRLIIQKIKEVNADLRFYSMGDIGIIFNERTYPISLSDVVKNASISRFFDPECTDEEMLEELIDSESFLASIDEKTPEGKTFCQLARWVNKSNLGGEVIYLLWEALRELEQQDFSSAIYDLELLSNSFYSHWRIDAYLIKAFLLNGQIEEASSLFNKKLSEVYVKYPRLIEKIVNLDLVLKSNERESSFNFVEK